MALPLDSIRVLDGVFQDTLLAVAGESARLEDVAEGDPPFDFPTLDGR